MGERVVIIGNAGGGKSVLAKRLSQALGLPLYRLDRLQWNPGWVPTPIEEYDHRHDALINGDRWIIDGFGPWASVERRFEAADTIVLIDHPIWVHFWWALKRQFMCLFRPRTDFVPGCPMLPMTGRLLQMIWQIHQHWQPKLVALAVSHQRHKHVYHVRSPFELGQFTAKHCAGGG